MKLKNKKTGEIERVTMMASYSGGELQIRHYPDEDFEADSQFKEYHSLAELNEEWEDYKPAEPLIKDEKIRKAVRVWAEAEEIESTYYKVPDTFESIDGTARIEFGVFGFDEGRYTIAELCGEEQE